MNEILFITFWLTYWFDYYAIFNFILLPKGISYLKRPYISGIFNTFLLLINLYIIIAEYSVSLYIFTGIILASTLLLFLTHTKGQAKIALTINCFFQQSLMALLHIVFPQISFVIKGVFFFLIHTPILLLKHARGKTAYIILSLSLVGGFLIFWIYSVLPFPYNFILCSLIHSLVYFLFYEIEKRYKIQIIV